MILYTRNAHVCPEKYLYRIPQDEIQTSGIFLLSQDIYCMLRIHR